MFVGRKKEIEILNRQYESDHFEFTVIYGRRRIGKTELLKQYIKSRNAVYYMALESNATTNLELLSNRIHEHTGQTIAYAPFQNYEALFTYLTALSKRERIVFAIDEYPYLAQAYPEISSIIQKYCDNDWKDTKLHLILCGSSMSFMENQILGVKSPLYGRRTAQIRLNPFNFFETKELLKPMKMEDVAVLHCATGGVAEYLSFVDPHKSLAANLISLFFEDSGRLYEEPTNYLKQELREPKIYNNILDAIAKGASKNGEIASKVQVQTGALNKYLDNLVELGIVVKKTPIGKSTSRKSIYKIVDGAFRFWYRYVFPNMSAIEMGVGKRLYEQYVESDISSFMGEGFEQIYLNYFDRMNELSELPVLITQRGRWWENNPIEKREEEIDLVGFGGDTAVFSEVKWTNDLLDIKVITGLIEKSKLLHSENQFFVFFSKKGYTKSAVEFAKGRKDSKLIDFGDISISW